MASVFICYSHLDPIHARELAALLEEARNTVWYDKELRGGQDWWETILNQIAHCNVFIYLLSQDSVNSSYCQAECREAERLRKRILPIVVRGGVSIPPNLSRLQYEDISDGITASCAVKITTQINVLAAEPVIDANPVRRDPTPLPPHDTASASDELLKRSLVLFPEAFLPLVIVVGDKRENPPKSPGDLLALSASTSDLRWILKLSLPKDTEIISDKVLLYASPEYLSEQFAKKNLLVIGSPAANHIARMVNETAFFRFMINSSTRQEIKRFNDQIKANRTNMAFLRNYVDQLAQDGERIRYYLNQLRRSGFIDPTYEFKTRGFYIDNDADYGVISLCRNPYADSAEFIAILAAGVHLPATMQSLILLSNANDEFRERQLGGVFRVTLYAAEWARRMENAVPAWSTEAYKPEDVRKGLEAISNHPYLQELGVSELDVTNQIEFLDGLMNERH